MYEPVRAFLEVQDSKEVCRTLCDFLPAQAIDTPDEMEVFPPSQLIEEPEPLGNHPNDCFCGNRFLSQVNATEFDSPLARRKNPGTKVDGGRFARSIGANQANDRPPIDNQFFYMKGEARPE